MSRIRADRYTNREGTGAPTFADGVNVVGISSLGITTVTGVGQTALTVNGDARITGVLTIGQVQLRLMEPLVIQVSLVLLRLVLHLHISLPSMT